MISIREATLSDISAITGFQIKMAMETESLVLDHNIVSKGVAAVFADNKLGKYYVAVSNKEVCASLLITPEWSDWRNSHVLWIQSVYVIPEFREKGVFKKMFEHLKDMVLRSENISGLRLYVDKSNKKARHVYWTLGMDGEHYELFEWMKPDSH